MTLENINYIAQTIGVLAILVSLIFVGIQVRQNSAQIEANTRSIKASAGFEATHSWAATNEQVFQLSEDVLIRAVASYAPERTWDDFSEGERIRMTLLHRALFQKLEGMYFLFRYGSLDRTIWEARLNWAASVIRLPFYRHWWAFEKTQSVWTDEFVAVIEAARDATAVVPWDQASMRDSSAPAREEKPQGGAMKS